MPAYVYAAVAAALVAVSSVQVEGMQTFLKQLPNGDKFSKQLGHTDSGYTPFGTAFLNAGTAWSADFCKQTFPGSKLTNGQAFGDPCCVWKAGAAAPQSVSAFTTDPGAGTKCATDAKPSTAPAAGGATTPAPAAGGAKTTAPASGSGGSPTSAPKADSSKAPSGEKKDTKGKDASKPTTDNKKDKKKCTKKKRVL